MPVTQFQALSATLSRGNYKGSVVPCFLIPHTEAEVATVFLHVKLTNSYISHLEVLLIPAWQVRHALNENGVGTLHVFFHVLYLLL